MYVKTSNDLAKQRNYTLSFAAVTIQVKVPGKNGFAGSYSGYDEYVPMVDKPVDACWKKPSSVQRSYSSKSEQVCFGNIQDSASSIYYFISVLRWTLTIWYYCIPSVIHYDLTICQV